MFLLRFLLALPVPLSWSVSTAIELSVSVVSPSGTRRPFPTWNLRSRDPHGCGVRLVEECDTAEDDDDGDADDEVDEEEEENEEEEEEEEDDEAES